MKWMGIPTNNGIPLQQEATNNTVVVGCVVGVCHVPPPPPPPAPHHRSLFGPKEVVRLSLHGRYRTSNCGINGRVDQDETQCLQLKD